MPHDLSVSHNASVRSSVESNYKDLAKNKPLMALKFHYVRRMADMIREEQERE